jgi:hypothetical protein
VPLCTSPPPFVYTSLTHFQTRVAISRSVPLPVYLSSTVHALGATSRRLLRARTSVPMLRSIGMISAAWEALELWPCRRGTHWAPLARQCPAVRPAAIGAEGITTSRVFVALVPAEIGAHLPPPGAPSVAELIWRSVLEHELAVVLKEALARQTWTIGSVLLSCRCHCLAL